MYADFISTSFLQGNKLLGVSMAHSLKPVVCQLLKAEIAVASCSVLSLLSQ